MNDKVPTYIELKGAMNARHLGGYEGVSGTTRDDAFVRMDSPTRLTEDDIELLLSRDIMTVIDLRADDELAQDPNPFQTIDDVDFHHISILDSNLPPHMMEGAKLEDLYYYIISDCHDAIAKVMRTIIASSGPVLFHCTAGKDRTGVISALLLSLVGVPEDVIVTEYSYTEILLSRWRETIMAAAKKQGVALDEEMLEAKPEFIRIALDHMNETYGDVVKYLHQIGLSDGEIEELKAHIV